MKKAQMQQVFTYIMVVIVVGIILTIGVRAIGNIINKACEVNEATFKINIENTLNRYSSFGSVGYETIKAPCPEYTQICFMTHNITQEGACSQALDNTFVSPEVKNIALNECTIQGHNVFLIKGTMIIPITINNINVTNNFLCIESRSGQFPLKIQGQGRTILISQDT